MTPFLKDVLKHKYMRIICIIIGLVAIMLVLVWGRAFYGSMQAYHQGETYLKQRQYIRAVTFFDRSIHWYTPFNPYVQRSAQGLWKIGIHAEQQGDIKLALIAFRTMRQGFYAASSFYTPGKRWIHKCDLKIHELMELEQLKKERPDGSKVKEKLPQSQKGVSPSIVWSIIVEIGFLGWIGSVIGFIMYTLGRKGESKYWTSLTLTWIGLTFVFFALWIIGMMKA